MAFIKSCSIDSRNEQNPTCEVVHETNKAHFRNLLSNRFLPQLVRHWTEDPEVLVSIPTGGNFFCSSLCKDLSDNLTEMPIVKNSINSGDLTPHLREILNSTLKGKLSDRGYPILPISSPGQQTTGTGYVAGGTPLVVTQEDFLLKNYFKIEI